MENEIQENMYSFIDSQRGVWRCSFSEYMQIEIRSKASMEIFSACVGRWACCLPCLVAFFYSDSPLTYPPAQIACDNATLAWRQYLSDIYAFTLLRLTHLAGAVGQRGCLGFIYLSRLRVLHILSTCASYNKRYDFTWF